MRDKYLQILIKLLTNMSSNERYSFNEIISLSCFDWTSETIDEIDNVLEIADTMIIIISTLYSEHYKVSWGKDCYFYLSTKGKKLQKKLSEGKDIIIDIS